MALPFSPMPKQSSGGTPAKSRIKLSRSQSLNLHDSRKRSPEDRRQDGGEPKTLAKTDGARTLPQHMRKATLGDMKYKDSRPRSELSVKMKLLFRRKSAKASRDHGGDASDVSGGSDGGGGLPLTASEEQCPRGGMMVGLTERRIVCSVVTRKTRKKQSIPRRIKMNKLIMKKI